MVEVPDSTAVRTALWRARHVELDVAPHVVDDVVGPRLLDAWFDGDRPAVVASTGVSMYLTKDVTFAVLQRVAGPAAGSTLAMTST